MGLEYFSKETIKIRKRGNTIIRVKNIYIEELQKSQSLWHERIPIIKTLTGLINGLFSKNEKQQQEGAERDHPEWKSSQTTQATLNHADQLFNITNIKQPVYATDTLTLESAQQYLCKDAQENILLVTGLKYGNLNVLSKLYKCKSTRSSCGVHVEPQDIFSTLIPLQKRGFCLLAVFHSHPGGGIPSPSSIDMRLQSMLEQHNYPTISAVFTPDGIRFFSRQLKFELIVGGNGYETSKNDPYALVFREALNTLRE